jgi:hypothetical protein
MRYFSPIGLSLRHPLKGGDSAIARALWGASNPSPWINPEVKFVPFTHSAAGQLHTNSQKQEIEAVIQKLTSWADVGPCGPSVGLRAVTT